MAFCGCGHLEQSDCFEDSWVLLDTRGYKDQVWEEARYKMLRGLGGRKHSGRESPILPSSVMCLRVHICGEKVLWTAVKCVPWLWQEGGR